MLLYDWIRLSHVEKCPNENNQGSFDDDIDEYELDDENNMDSEDENNKMTFHCFFYKIILCITHTMWHY